jgi:hypothetical protein
MFLGEGSSGSALQVDLEAHRFPLVFEPDCIFVLPGPEFGRVGNLAGIVSYKACFETRCNSNVVPIRGWLAFENVDIHFQTFEQD